MKTNLTYPKIPWSNYPLTQCVAFEKYDGTNVHFVWDLSKDEYGWIEYGTRRTSFLYGKEGCAFDLEHPGLERVMPIFFHKFSKSLGYKLKELKIEKATIFFEFWGKESFAGEHIKDDPKYLTLIDVEVDGKIISPGQFLLKFGDLKARAQENDVVAKVIYSGKYNGQFIEDVRNGNFDVNEGVVCKGEKNGEIYMVKIKTNSYMDKIKRLSV